MCSLRKQILMKSTDLMRKEEKIGINLENVYALIGYKKNISDSFLEFSKSTKANIIFYEDERVDVKLKQ